MGGVALVALAIAIPWVVGSTVRGDQRLVLSTGGKGGTYLPLGEGVAAAARTRDPPIHIDVVESAGAIENMRRLELGEAELAFVQNDTKGRPDIRTVAPLYHEVLHFLARRDARITRLGDVRGKRVAVGPSASGTRALVRELLGHYGLAEADFDARAIATSAAVNKLIAGEIDAVFVLAGLKSSACQKAVDSGLVEFVGLGEAGVDAGEIAGFRYTYPFAEAFVIPTLTYATDSPAGGLPARPTATVAVRAMLVTRRDVDATVIRGITESMFQNRADLVRAHPTASEIDERFDPSRLQFPLHPGAAAHYARDEPGFLVKYAESMAFLLSLAMTLFAVAVTLQKWLHRRKKNRIDEYYVRLDEIFTVLDADTPSLADCESFREELVAMRRQAFKELVAEQLRADAAFRIFQDYWAECMERTEALLETDRDSTPSSTDGSVEQPEDARQPA